MNVRIFNLYGHNLKYFCYSMINPTSDIMKHIRSGIFNLLQIHVNSVTEIDFSFQHCNWCKIAIILMCIFSDILSFLNCCTTLPYFSADEPGPEKSSFNGTIHKSKHIKHEKFVMAAGIPGGIIKANPLICSWRPSFPRKKYQWTPGFYCWETNRVRKQFSFQTTRRECY